MNRPRIALLAVALGVSGTVTLQTLQSGQDVERMTTAAGDFLASLSDAQQAQATFPFDSEERGRHHFIPPEVFERHGVSYADLGVEQRVRAQDLLRSGLSQQGYLTAQQIMEVEGILGVLVEGEGRQFSRSPEAYWVSVFGSPSTTGTWGWRWEGHHLSLHLTVVDGAITVSTPTFLGANPATVPSGARKGLRAMKAQEDSARDLLASLDAGQREVAIFDDVAPTNVVTGADLVVDPLDPIGIQGSALSSGQQEMLMAVVDSYISIMADGIADLRRAAVHEGGIENTWFAWAGPTERGAVAYYRVQGPNFLIEFDNTQEDPNHIHAAFRDFDGDLGRDLLREHLAQDH
jgi:hypothetical protein